jgi:hypothetical protein
VAAEEIAQLASIPQELQAFVPAVAVPVQPLIAAGAQPSAMYADHRWYP